MSWIKGLKARITSILRPRAAEARMDEEFRFHLEMEIDKNVRAGMERAEARRRALIAFGGLEGHREAMRDGRGARVLGDLGRDARVAFRDLGRNPGFTVIAVLTIAFGVGATTAIFSAVDAVLLRPLPFAEPDRLVELDDVVIPYRSEDREYPKTRPDIADARAATDVFSHVAAYAPGGMNLSGLGTPRRIPVGVVTVDLFDTLGVRPVLGREFTSDEGVPGAPRVALVSHRLWRGALGAEPDAVGRTIALNGRSHEVVGVMPRGFGFPAQAEVWVPMSVPLTSDSFEAFRQYIPSRLVARLAAGVTIEQAGARVRALLAHYASPDRPVEATAATLVKPLRGELVGDGGTALLVLLGATALVLLVASANVANLLLSRGIVRRREIALRAVLGASSLRLVRQLLTESTLLALIGGASGVGVAVGGVRLLDTLVPAALSGVAPVRVDVRVLAFALLVAVATGLGFGLWPALAARRTGAAEALKSGGAGPGTGAETARLRRAFVVGEVALALMLLIGSSLMLRSLHRLLSAESGVHPQGVATLELTLAEADFPTTEARRQFYETVLEQLERRPDVEAAAAINELPLRGEGGVRFLVYPEGHKPDPDRRVWAQDLRVTPDYFRTMGIRILKGRPPERRVGADVGEVTINEELASFYWPGKSPIGARLQWPNDIVYEVVGVVSNVRPSSLDAEVIPQAYSSLLDTPYDNAALVARGRAPAEALAGVLQGAVRTVAPRQAVYNVRTMEEVIAGAIAPRRTRTALITAFGAVALILAAVGVYGIMSFGVARRTREIGIRMALGAEPRRVIGGVVAEGMVLTLAGTLPGLAGAWLLSRFLDSFVYGITTTDPLAFTAAPVVLLVIATVAALVPAWRATRVSAVEAIRVE